MRDEPPRVVHIIHRLAPGGLENGLVNLINHMNPDAVQHAVVALDQIGAFADRITRPGVPLIALEKPRGQGFWLYPRLLKTLRELSPSLIHTRGLGALEMSPLGRWIGVPVVQGEHGWDAFDPGGVRLRYRLLRRAFSPFVNHYIAVSEAIRSYLEHKVGVPDQRITTIPNGVDVRAFAPRQAGSPELPENPFAHRNYQVIGSVMRVDPVKDPMTLLSAFGRAVRLMPTLRLVIVGEGPLLPELKASVAASGLVQKVWLPGHRDDIAQLMQSFDVYVCSSRAEGMSNTLLEAMACGLPVIATRVGGNPEVVVPGETGELVLPGRREALAQAMLKLAGNPARSRGMGQAGRSRVESSFSLGAMVDRYAKVYQNLLGAFAGGGQVGRERP